MIWREDTPLGFLFLTDANAGGGSVSVNLYVFQNTVNY
jgi:hypothetical protein